MIFKINNNYPFKVQLVIIQQSFKLSFNIKW